MHPMKEYEFRLIHPQIIQDLSDMLLALDKTFSEMRLGSITAYDSKIDQEQQFIIELLRAHTQNVRNWGYFHYVVNIMKDLLEPLDKSFEKELGLRGSFLICLFEAVLSLYEARVNNHFDKLRAINNCQSIAELWEKYSSLFPNMAGDSMKEDQFYREWKASLKQLKMMHIAHSDLQLSDLIEFKLDDLMSLLPQESDQNNLGKLLDMLSLPFGDLQNDKPEHFFLDNPIWKKPFIKFSLNSYLLPVPTSLFSHINEIIKNLVMACSNDLISQYRKRRSDFLEKAIENTIKEKLPGALVYRNLIRRDPQTGQEIENDILVLFDSCALLIEAKSGMVTDIAKRGVLERVKKKIDELIVAPSMQSAKFADFIFQNSKICFFKTKNGNEVTIDLSKVKKVLRLSVTLEDFATIQTFAAKFKEAGFIAPCLELAPTMVLSDFLVVMDILESPKFILHYLSRRPQFETNAEFMADEIDLLAFYCDTTFNIGPTEFDKTKLVLLGMSKAIDTYYNAISSGLPSAKKPAPRLTQWWADILTTIEARHFDRWVEASLLLLNVAYKDQLKIKKYFKKITKNVHRNWRIPGHECAVILTSDVQQKEEAFVFFAYKQVHFQTRHQLAQDIINKVSSQSHAKFYVVLGVNIDSDDYPYSFIGVYDISEN